jgi:hypothetical protein
MESDEDWIRDFSGDFHPASREIKQERRST